MNGPRVMQFGDIRIVDLGGEEGLAVETRGEDLLGRRKWDRFDSYVRHRGVGVMALPAELVLRMFQRILELEQKNEFAANALEQQGSAGLAESKPPAKAMAASAGAGETRPMLMRRISQNTAL